MTELEIAQKLKGLRVRAKKREIGSSLGISSYFQNGGEGEIKKVIENKGRILFEILLTRNDRTMLVERDGFILHKRQPPPRPKK